MLQNAEVCDMSKALPVGRKVVSVTAVGPSDFCKTFRIEVALPDGTIQAFFQKVCLTSSMAMTHEKTPRVETMCTWSETRCYCLRCSLKTCS